MEQLNEQDLLLVRKAAHDCQLVGDDRFREQIERHYGVKLDPMKRDRPRTSIDELVDR